MLTMLRPYISDARIGDGYRTAFLMGESRETATLYLPSELATVSVPKASLVKAAVIAYRSKVVRRHMLKRARLYRRHGHRFPRKATIEVLSQLGAGTSTIEALVHTEPLPEVIAARERRALQAEQAIETAYVAAAIRTKIELQPAEQPAPPSRSRRSRQPYVHPDQLVLGL
jgi:hypothetical protein